MVNPSSSQGDLHQSQISPLCHQRTGSTAQTSTTIHAVTDTAAQPETFLMLPSAPAPTIDSLSLEDFILVHADIFKGSTQLDRQTTLMKSAQLLKTLLNLSPSDPEIKKVQEKIDCLATWGEIIGKIQSKKEIKETASTICRSVQALNKGEGITLPGGYYGNPLIYQITKTTDTFFDFQIINSGDGSQYHYTDSQGLKTKIAPLLTIKDITLEELIGTEDHPRTFLFTALLSFQLPTSNLGSVTIEQVYAAIVGFFKHKNIAKEQLFITPQRSQSSSSWKSLMALVRQTMSTVQYKRAVFFMKQNTLTLFFNTNQKLLKAKTRIAHQARETLRFSAEKLSSRTSKIASESLDILTSEEINSAQTLLKQILDKVDEYEKATATEKTASLEPIHIKGLVKPRLQTTPWVPPAGSAIKARTVFSSIPPLDFTGKSFLENINHSQHFFLHDYETSNRLRKQLIIDFVRKVPKPWNTIDYPNFYQKIPSEEIPLVLTKLYHYFNAYIELGTVHHFKAGIDKITLFSLYALILDLSFRAEQLQNLPEEDRLSKFFGPNLNSEDLIAAENLIRSPYERAEWESIRAYFQKMTPDPIVHQDSYTLDLTENPRPTNPQQRLLYYLCTFTNRHLEKLTKVAPDRTILQFIKELFIGANNYRSYDSRSRSYCEIFEKIGFGHLPILISSTLYAHHLFSGKKKIPSITLKSFTIPSFGSNQKDFLCILGVFYKDFEEKKVVSWSTYSSSTVPNTVSVALTDITGWAAYGEVKSIKGPTEILTQRTLLDIENAPPTVQSQAEANLVNDPNLATEESENHLRYVHEDLALDPKLQQHQIPKADGPRAIKEAEARIAATKEEMPYLIAHAATHNSLRPIELLSLGLQHLPHFDKVSTRTDFLHQFFKLSLNSSKATQGAFDLIEDRNFQRAFLMFLSRYKDSTLQFPIFIFGMKIGVLLLQYVTEDSFETAICTELEALDLALDSRKHPRERRSIHLLLALKEAIKFQKLCIPQTASSVGQARDISSDEIHASQQKCFNTLLRHWMSIKIKEDTDPELEDIHQFVEDLIYPILGLPIAEKLIDDQAIKDIVKDLTGFEIAKELPSRPLKHNPMARMFDDPNATCINLFSGEISTKRDRVSVVEFDQAYSINAFKMIFGEKNFKFSHTDGWYHFHDPVQGSFRVQTTPIFLLQRLIGDDWAKLEEDPREGGVEIAPSSPMKQYKNQIQAHCQILTTDFFCYQGAKGYYYLPIGGNTSAYFIPRDPSFTIQKIDLASQDVLCEIIPVTFLSENFQKIISRFENPSLVYLEKKSAGSIKLVFPRYKSSSNEDTSLTFILSGEDFLLETNQSKRLCTKFRDKLMGNFGSFLALENTATKKLSALIPGAPYQANYPSFATGAKLDLTLSDDLSRHIQSLSYDDIPFETDQFTPATVEHKLRLLYLAIGQVNFESALFYLKQLFPSDLQRPAQRKIAGDLLQNLAEAEQTPQSIALQMQLGYLLFYYDFMKGISPPPEQEAQDSSLYKIGLLYNRYCNRLGHIPTPFRLTFAQESLLLQKSPVLSSAMQARIASCPALHPKQKALVAARTESTPIYLSTSLPSIEYLVISKDTASLKYMEEKALAASQGIDPLTLLELVKTNPYIYDIVYDARNDLGQKKDLSAVLHLASCLTRNSTAPEDRLLHKLFLMLNHSDTPPPPLRSLELHKVPLSERAAKIEDWKAVVTSYFDSLNNVQTLQLPQIELKPAPPLYPHLEVLTPPNARQLTESSAEELTTRAEAGRLSWSGMASECKPLSTFAILKGQINQTVISFNYGSICDRQSIKQVEEIALAQSDPLLKPAFREAFENFLKGFDSIEEEERLIPALDTAQLESMGIALNEMISETEALVKTQLTQILELARSPFPEERLAKVASGLLIAGLTKEVTIEKLGLLFLSSDAEAFKQVCPQLTQEKIQALYHMIGEYFYLSIHLQQMHRLAGAMITLKEELSSSSVKHAIGPDGQMLRPEVVSKARALKTIAAQGIKGTPSPQHLLFQYSSHMFRTRPDQLRVIQELERPTDKIAQVLMGGGKTTVFAANLLAKACAEGKIAILITPNFQYEAVYKTIQATLKQVFGIEVVTLQYKKEQLTLQVLEALEITLLRIKQSAAHLEPKVLLVRPETLQFLTLEWLHTLNEIKAKSSPSQDLIIKYKTLSNILKLLKKEGISLGDEVHVLLDIIKEIHIPIGPLQSVDQENIALIRDIFKVLNNITIPVTAAQKDTLKQQLWQSEEDPLEFTPQPDGNFTIQIDQLLKIKDNKQSYCSATIYKQIILPNVAACLALTNKQILMLDTNEQESFCRYVQGEIKGDLQEALLMDKATSLTRLEAQDLAFLEHLRNLHNSSNSQEKKAADLIALTKYTLSDLLPLLLSKTGNIHFGRTRDQNTPGEVVPYICANVPSGNKFGNHYEAIIYHFMCALMFGVEEEQIKQLFSAWDTQAKNLMRGTLTYDETPSAAICKHLFGILPCQLEETGNLEKVKLLLKDDEPLFINRLFAVEEHTIQTYVTYQKETISAHAHMLADLCNRFQGLSGTFHLEEFFLKLQANPELDVTVNPLCIRAFLEKPSKVFLSQEISPELFIEENFNKLSDSEKAEACAILDPAGVFKDFENKAVAQALLNKLQAQGRTDIKAVIFFTRLNGSVTADHPVLMRVNSDEVEQLHGTSIEELSSKGLNPGDYAVYLDSHHCTGTDISLSPNAVGLLTYDPSIGLDTATQAIMRFRNYLSNQSLVVVVMEYSCSLLPKTDKTIQELVTADKFIEAKSILVAQMIIKQVEQGSGKMIKAFRKMLEYAVFQKAKELLFSTDDLETIQKIVRGFTSSLFHLTEDVPYLSFGSLSREIDTLKSLEKTSGKILSELKQNLQAAKFDSTHIDNIIETIETEHRTILARAEDIKPQFIAKVMELISGSPLGTEGSEIEIAINVERENEVQQEMRQEVQQEIEEEIQKDLAALQLRKKQEPKSLNGFNPAHFLEQLSSESPIHGSIEPVQTLFNPPLHAYASLFEDSTLLITSHFRQPYKNRTNILDASHVKARPFEYLLIAKLQNSSYHGVVVSGFEGSELKKHLLKFQTKDVWLTSPSGLLHAGDPSEWDKSSSNKTVKQMMITFNLLGGNTPYLIKHLSEYCQWAYIQNQTPSKAANLTKLLKLIAAAHPLNKKLILDLTDPQTLTTRLSHLDQLKRILAFDSVSSSLVLNKSTAPLLSALQIQGLTPNQVKSIAQYLSPAQISLLPGRCIKELPANMLIHLSPRQAHYIRKKEDIQSLPLDFISRLREEDLPTGSQFIDHLTEYQYQALTDPSLINQVSDAKLTFINPEMSPHIGSNISRLKALIGSNPSCYSHLSRSQLESLSKEEDAATYFNRIPLESIKKLPLTESTQDGTGQECHGFICFLNQNQKEQLTAEQIKKIKLGKDLALLSSSKWLCGNEKAIKEISISRIRLLSSSELTEHLIGKFSEEQIQGFTKEQVVGLSDFNKCPYLSREQLDFLSSAQYAEITNEVLIRKIPDRKLRYIQLGMTPKIGPDPVRLQSLSTLEEPICLHFGYLSRDQLEALSKVTNAKQWFRQIPDFQIPLLDVTSTTNPGTKQECHGFISLLSKDQKAALTPTQIEKIEQGADLAQLLPHQWRHGNTRAIHQLSPLDIKKIPAREIALTNSKESAEEDQIDEDPDTFIYDDEDDIDYPKGELTTIESPSLLSRLTIEQIQALTEPQVRSITDPNQCPDLTQTQVGWLGTEQCRKLTNEALIKQLPHTKLIYIPITETSKIGPSPSGLRSLVVSNQECSKHFAYLSREQLEVLRQEKDAAALFKMIPLHAIETLDLTRDTQGHTGLVDYLTQEQREKLTQKQIALIKDPKHLNLLSPAAWQHAMIEALHGLPLERIETIPLKELTPLLLRKLSEPQIQALNQAQVKSIEDPNLCPYLTNTQVSWLTNDQYKKLTHEALIEKVPDEKICFIDPIATSMLGPNPSRLRKLLLPNQAFCPHFAYLSRKQLEALGQEDDAATLFKNIPLDAIKTLKLTLSTEGCTGLIHYLSDPQKDELTQEQIALIKDPNQLELIPSGSWQHATIAALHGLPIEKIERISSKELTPLLLGKLALEQVHSLTTAQVQSLEDPNQCLCLSEAQVALLTTAQYKKLNNPWLIKKVPDERLILINPEATGHIGLDYKRLKRLGLNSPIYTEHFAHLTRDQLELILEKENGESQTEAIEEIHFSLLSNFSRDIRIEQAPRRTAVNLLHKIPPTAICKLPLTEIPSLIKHLKVEQLEQLTPNQIEKIEQLDDLLFLPAHLWQHGKESLLRNLTEDQIQKIPSAGITDTLLTKLSQEQAENFTKKQIRGIDDPNQCVKLPAAQLTWLPQNQLYRLTCVNREQIHRIMSLAAERFAPPPKIKPREKSFRSIPLGNEWLPKEARSTRDCWLELQTKQQASPGISLPFVFFKRFEASSDKQLELLWADVFDHPGSIIIDLTTYPQPDRLSYYPTQQSPWWYDPELSAHRYADGSLDLTPRGRRSANRKNHSSESYEPFSFSSGNDFDDQDLSPEEIQNHHKSQDTHEKKPKEPRGSRNLMVTLMKTDPKTNVQTYTIIQKKGKNSALTSQEDEKLDLLLANQRGEAEFECSFREVQQYHYPKWPADGIISVQNLDRLIKNIQIITHKAIIERKKFLMSIDMDMVDFGHVKPFFWLRENKESGSADTIMAAYVLKEKFDAGEISANNFDDVLADIILTLRKDKEASPQFLLNKQEHLDLLRRYANALIRQSETPSLPSGKPRDSNLWKILEDETLKIDQSSWVPQCIGDLPWPIETQEIPPGNNLTAHRVAKSISERYFVACKAPVKDDWELFWKSIFEKNASIVDLTEHEGFISLNDFTPGLNNTTVYYPKSTGETIICGDISITCSNIEGIIATYELTDTSATPPITKTIKRCHYKQWPDGTAITIPELQNLITTVETLAPDPKNPLWIHCHMGVGRTGTLITAFVLKEKISKGELDKENLQKDLLDMIITFRKERSAHFINSSVQFDLLYKYALDLFNESPGISSKTGSYSHVTRPLPPKEQPVIEVTQSPAPPPNMTETLSTIKTRLWGELEKETTEIDPRSWGYLESDGRIWPILSQEVFHTEVLTAHRVGKETSDRYLVASKAPTLVDAAKFWEAILKENETSIVDLTENTSYAQGQKLYYPEKVEEAINYEHILVTCLEIFGNRSIYQVTNTSTDPMITKCISRYHYKDWKNDSAITQRQLEQLIQEVESFSPNPKNPLWIHCYFGVGRTGTLITALSLKEKFQKGELTKQNLEKTLVDTIIGFRKERALDFVRNKEQLGLLYEYARGLLENHTIPTSATRISDPFFPAPFIRERGGGGDCAALSLLDQLVQRGIKKNDGSDFTSHQEVRKIASDYIRGHIDDLAQADITTNTTPDALLMTAVVSSLLDNIGSNPDHILASQRYNKNAVLSSKEKKDLLTEYGKLIDMPGSWLDKGFFQVFSRALGRQIVILRPEENNPLDVYISERFPEGAIDETAALFIYYNGTTFTGGNHYQSIDLHHSEKIRSLIQKDKTRPLKDFIESMKHQKVKQEKIGQQTPDRAIEHALEIASAVDHNLSELSHRNHTCYKAVCDLLRERLRIDNPDRRPLDKDVINAILSLNEEEIRSKMLS